MRERWSETRIDDILTFLSVRRSGSVSGAARELKVTPSQVSKAVERLSRDLGRRLHTRTIRGVALTEEGLRLAPELEDVVVRFRLALGHDKERSEQLGFAAPSYLVTPLLAHAVAALPKVRLRVVELAPALIRVHSTARLFDAALMLGRDPLPEPWVCLALGEVRKSLFASPALAKKLRPFPVAPESLRDIPFVNPVYFANGQLAAGDDDCPIGRNDRRLGHETTTIGLGLELATRAEQLVFGPYIAARSYIERGLLEEIPVRGWAVTESLQIACHSDRVLAKVQKALVRGLRTAFTELSGPIERR